VAYFVGDNIAQVVVLLAKIAVLHASREDENTGVQNFSGYWVALNVRSRFEVSTG
jgi:hypothetical protein